MNPKLSGGIRAVAPLLSLVWALGGCSSEQPGATAADASLGDAGPHPDAATGGDARTDRDGTAGGEATADGDATPAGGCGGSALMGMFGGRFGEVVDAYSTWLGRPMQLGMDFEASSEWGQIDGTSNGSWQMQPWSEWLQAEPGRGFVWAIPMLPKDGSTLAACAAGVYDIHWTGLANELHDRGFDASYLRLGWEMDGDWYAWHASAKNPLDPVSYRYDFAGCFRKIVDAMKEAQPGNDWKFVYNPTNSAFSNLQYVEDTWPGDAYVDVVGMDLYDQSWLANTYPYPADCGPYTACGQARQKTAWDASYAQISAMRDFAQAHGKPLAFPEWGVMQFADGHGGLDNPYFVQQMYEFISDPANDVEFHIIYDDATSSFDTRLSDAAGPTQFPEASELFRQLFGCKFDSG